MTQTDATIKTTYRGVEITYLKDPNRWRFTVNGRERSAESLTKAEESIDRALTASPKNKPWQPFEAYMEKRYDDGEFKKVKVTSIAEPGGSYSRGLDFWVSADGERSKQSGSGLYKVCAENESLFADIKRLYGEIAEREGALRAARSNLIRVEVPTDEE